MLKGLQSGPENREPGVTIITEVCGHALGWHLHSLCFMSRLGLPKPRRASPLTSGCFKSRSNPALMTASVHRNYSYDFPGIGSGTKSNYYLLQLMMIIETQNYHRLKKAGWLTMKRCKGGTLPLQGGTINRQETRNTDIKINYSYYFPSNDNKQGQSSLLAKCYVLIKGRFSFLMNKGHLRQ